MKRVTTGYEKNTTPRSEINDLAQPKTVDKGLGSATNHEKNHVQNLTEFKHWSAEAEHTSGPHPYIDWLEARSARLRKIEDQSCAEWLKAEAERLARTAIGVDE